MRKLVIALSGGIGAGKADLGKQIATTLGGDRVSFGVEVRRYASEIGGDQNDVSALQRLGHALVLTQPKNFVRRVLAQSHRLDVPLIVEGVRHADILLELKGQTEGAAFRLFHIDTPRSVREDRIMKRENVERRLAARYDNDITEAQAPRVIPQYADAIIDGELPVPLQVAQIVSRLGLGAQAA